MLEIFYLKFLFGISLKVQRLRFCTPNARGLGSTPSQGPRPHMPQLKIYTSQRKHLAGYNEDGRSHIPQLTPSTDK